MTGTNAWQPLTNIALGPNPVVVQRPFDATDRFYRGGWLRWGIEFRLTLWWPTQRARHEVIKRCHKAVGLVRAG